jgi:hypothetical protein
MSKTVPTSAMSDWELACSIGMWLDYDQTLSEFEKGLIADVLLRFDANDRSAFKLTAHEREALEPAWEAIAAQAALDDPEAA